MVSTSVGIAADLPELHRERRAVLVADLVESVRLVAEDEEDAVRRWTAFVADVSSHLLVEHGGRLVKSLGDGLLLEFSTASRAVECALAMRDGIARQNWQAPAHRTMHLRFGLHVADVVVDMLDIYGAGVNLAARLATLARPGDIVVSAEARDQFVPGLDPELDDMGDCFLKHLEGPVRAFKVAGPPLLPALQDESAGKRSLDMSIAVIPFTPATSDSAGALVGELIADNAIVWMSKQPGIRVISRLTTTALRDRGDLSRHARTAVRVAYVLTGTFTLSDGRLSLTAKLIDTRTTDVLWADHHRASLGDLLQSDSAATQWLCGAVLGAIRSAEAERASSLPLPNLESYALLLGAVTLMHRSSRRDFDRAEELLSHLVERHARLATPRAWLAKWHVLRVTRGMATDIRAEADLALSQTQRALDNDPTCALALAMEGFVHCHLRRDLETAEHRYEAALEANPSESIAWLFKSILHAFRGEGERAMDAASTAIGLSPLDPLRYYYESLAASAAFSAGRYEEAVTLALRSLRANRAHSSTLRVLAMAQALSGRVEAARASVQQLLVLEPGFKVSTFIARSPAASFAIGQVCADALRMAGVPD